MQNFIYFVGDGDLKEVIVIDPAWDAGFLINEAKKNDLKIVGVLVTHGHFDHTNGVEELLNKLDVPVYINKLEADFFKFKWGKENVRKVESGEKLNVGNIEIQFIVTDAYGCKKIKTIKK